MQRLFSQICKQQTTGLSSSSSATFKTQLRSFASTPKTTTPFQFTKPAFTTFKTTTAATTTKTTPFVQTSSKRQFSNEGLRPNAEPYDPYKNKPITNNNTSNTTPEPVAAPIHTPHQQPPQFQQPYYNQQQASLETEPIRYQTTPQQQQQLPPDFQPVYPPNKPNFFKRNPWLIPQFFLTTPLIGVIIYQQILMNEIVSHTQAVEGAVEQFGDILEYHHNILGQMVDFPEDGMAYPEDDYQQQQQQQQQQGQPPSQRGPPSMNNFNSRPPQMQPPPQPPQGPPGSGAPPQPPLQPGQRQPYQPRSGLFPQQGQPADNQRVPSGYPFNQQ